MLSMSWTAAPAGYPAAGPAVRRRGIAPVAAPGLAGFGRAVNRRAREAFATPLQRTGLPAGGSVRGAVVQAALRHEVIDTDATGTTPLGIHSSSRPPS